MIPREIGGVEADVFEVGNLKFLNIDRTKRYRPFPMGLSCGDVVLKSGRTTGVTKGTVHAVDYETNVQMGKEGKKVAHFVDQILVNNDSDKFSAPEDIGRAVINQKDSLIRLLFAGSNQVTICNKIHNVLEELKIRIDVV